jgi:hypothetical protein
MKNRRALSSVVGTVFSIIALTTTFGYISYSMNALNQYNNAILTQNQQLSNVASEKFSVGSVLVNNNKLNVTLVNTGNLPINFTKIWIQNMTGTNWIQGYAPTPPNDFVAPGAVLKNLGQNIPVYINPANSYNVKLVTSRGNSQAFTVNSAKAVPLNIQLMFLPDTVASGFKTKLVMIVTNNSTGTLTNITPSTLPSPTYNGSGTTVCTASTVSPSSYNTIAPGSTAIFTWDVTVSGYGMDTCTYTINQPLQNGYLQTVQATATVTVVQLSDSNYAQNAGVVSDTYANFHWTEGNTWNNDWSFPHTGTIDFSVVMTNNNQTVGGYSLWMSENTQLMIWQTSLNTNGKPNLNTFYIVKPPVNLNGPTITAYSDYSQGIQNQGGSTTVYFGANNPGSSQQTGSLAPGTYFGFIVIYGKFTIHSGDTTGGLYAQTIPFMAIVSQ